jgi:hypothetical protein
MRASATLRDPADVLAGKHTTQNGGKTSPRGCLPCAVSAAADLGASGRVPGTWAIVYMGRSRGFRGRSSTSSLVGTLKRVGQQRRRGCRSRSNGGNHGDSGLFGPGAISTPTVGHDPCDMGRGWTSSRESLAREIEAQSGSRWFLRAVRRICPSFRRFITTTTRVNAASHAQRKPAQQLTHGSTTRTLNHITESHH